MGYWFCFLFVVVFYCEPNKWVIGFVFLLLMCFTVSATRGLLVLFFIVVVFYCERNKWVIGFVFYCCCVLL